VNDASSDSHGGGPVGTSDRPPPWRCGPGRRPRSARAAFAVALGLALLGAGCRPRGSGEGVTAPARPLSEVLAAHTPEWMAFPGVVGTAESRLPDGRPCILVLVARLTPELRAKIPANAEGWPVRIEETGEIHAMPDSSR
jgi:hypothetical protein